MENKYLANLVKIQSLSVEDLKCFYHIRYSEFVHAKFGGTKPNLNSHLEWASNIDHFPNYLGFGIIAGTKLIGGCSFKNISSLNKNAEFDLFISYENSGKGFGKYAFLNLLKIGFEELNLHRIYAFLLENNFSAFNLYKKFGFRQEGILRENVVKGLEYQNSLIIGLLKSEYENNH